MIISHKYKFIFVKTMKTAGTSIEIFLSRHCAETDILTPIWPEVDPHYPRNYRGIWNPFPEILHKSGLGIRKTAYDFVRGNRYYNHIPASSIRQRTPKKIWDSYFKFCVERNPWDKTLSHYHMLNSLSGGTISFEKYISTGNYCINFPKYTDSNGAILVDKVIKYENLVTELGLIFKQLGIPFSGSLGVRAKSEYRKDRRPYQDIYSEKQKKIIEKAFSREIEIHGYTF